MALVYLENISKNYGSKVKTKALDNCSVKVERGEMLAIMGKSGSGKSTLLNIIAGIDGYDSGTYLFDDENMEAKKGEMTEFRREHVGFVVQHFALIDDMTVRQNISLLLDYMKISKVEKRKRIEEVTEQLEIQDKLDCYPNELSGGQAQRVAIARAIINNPDILLADEPTGALDISNSQVIMKMFRELNQKGMTIVLVTHDENVAKKCDRIIYIQDGKVIEDEEEL